MRNHNWHIALAHLIEERREKPFAWGRHDCCLFCADAAVLICGIDPAEHYRGRYQDEESAYQALEEVGDGTIEGAWSKHFEPVEPRLIQRGDVCLIEGNKEAKHPQSHHACALCFGARLWVITPGRQGLRTLPTDQTLKAWRVE